MKGCLTPPIGLIAGSGTFPLLLARERARRGQRVVAVAHEGETLPELKNDVAEMVWIRLGALSPLIAFFKERQVTEVIMAGGIRKTRLFEMRPDARCAALLSHLTEKSDDMLLRAVADALSREGFSVVAATEGRSDLLAPEGEMTRPLTEAEQRDVRWGWQLAKSIGALDIGQCVVVREGILLAVEAIEGTDAAIRRGGELSGGQAVVIKVCKPGQDTRFDLPTVGADTIATMKAAGACVLAVEAGMTLMFDRADLLAQAHAADIAVVGITEPALKNVSWRR